jgi:hypothetical protein
MMPRTKGALGRKPEDKVDALRQWLYDVKCRRTEEDGCCICGDSDVNNIVMRYRIGYEQHFPLSRAPFVPGMTRDKLAAIIETCDLVCRHCWKGFLRDRRDPSSGVSLFLNADKLLSDMYGIDVGEWTAALNPPDEIVMFGRKYRVI